MSEWTEVSEPKVWVSRFHSTNDGSVSFNWTCRGEKLDYIHAFRDNWQTVPESQGPASIFFRDKREIPVRIKDAFRITDALFVISPKFHGVLTQFNIGDTQLFEVPIYQDKEGTPSDLPNHYVMNVHAPVETLIPELSTDIRQPHRDFEPPFEGHLMWAPNYRKDVLAVQAKAAEKFDLWHDPQLRDRFFLSDRLKTAIDAAGLQVKAMELVPARVFREE